MQYLDGAAAKFAEYGAKLYLDLSAGQEAGPEGLTVAQHQWAGCQTH
jgi:hypothetical protein